MKFPSFFWYVKSEKIAHTHTHINTYIKWKIEVKKRFPRK